VSIVAALLALVWRRRAHRRPSSHDWARQAWRAPCEPLRPPDPHIGTITGTALQDDNA
jgi:hypothetical protein